MNTKYTSLILILAITSLAYAERIPMDLNRQTQTFISPNGVTEYCVALAKLPIGDYKKKDVEEEQRLCRFNFYNDTVALCPKTWSTSPATIVEEFLQVDGINLADNSKDAEKLCGYHTELDKLAKFKQTMNQADTSGTFSAAPLLYYHLSRALDTDVTITPAVFRTMDKDEHFERVSSVAAPKENAKMNIAGWNWLRKAETNPAGYNAAADLLTSDRKQIIGSLSKDKGERYKVEINGTQENGWGKGQNFDFQKTPAFLALRTPGPIQTAISIGFAKATENSTMKAAFPKAPSTAQMVLWMNEVSEIALLDFIMSQQDRIGNIDYRWYWAYLTADGEVETDRVTEDQFEELPLTKSGKIIPPTEIKNFNPVLIQKTFLGDNDAGGLIKYANYSKATTMLDGWAHMNKGLYQRLIKLAHDFKNKGPNYQVLATEMPLITVTAANGRLTQFINNTILAAGLLEKSCRAGTMKLDLVSIKKALKNNFEVDETECGLAKE